MQKTVLIAEDDSGHRAMLRALLKAEGYAIREAGDGMEAAAMCRRETPDLLLMDVRMPRLDGHAAFEQIHAACPDLPVIIMTAYSDLAQAVGIMRKGAWDYLPKPLDPAKLLESLAGALNKRVPKHHPQAPEEQASPKSPIRGKSPAIRRLLDLIRAVAPTEAVCLITGESGTGKELAARALHQQSNRADGPFVAVNCGALTEGLQTSEFFGHEKGAFTGAIKTRSGLFAQASGGTLFLDEIGEMPPAMQAQLLRVLQEKEILPVGSSTPVAVNCRIMAATNRNLDEEVKAGRFRQDLFYRLNVVNLHMPPLRERKEDIEQLAKHFAEKFARQNNRAFSGLAPEALACLKAWPWPGNVRELENVMERAIILMPGDTINLRELPEFMHTPAMGEPGRAGAAPAEDAARIYAPAPGEPAPADTWPTLEEVERQVIMETLKKHGNNKTEAARALGITRKTLHAKLNRYLKDSE